MDNNQETAGNNTRRRRVHSAETCLNVLKSLATLGGDTSLSTLSSQLGENPAKVHRYLASLIESGFVFQDAVTGRYVLGLESISVGLAAVRRSDALTYASLAIADLTKDLGVTCFISVLGNMGPTIVRWEEPLRAVVVNVRAGSVLPILWSASGRVFGAHTNSLAIDTLIEQDLKTANPLQNNELPDKKAVRDMLKTVRTTGCASIQNTLLAGIGAVAAPVFDYDGRIPAVITALGVVDSFNFNAEGVIATSVMESAAKVSSKLGYTPSDH
jgi:DNA-binding IclR family transcriptional regulator